MVLLRFSHAHRHLRDRRRQDCECPSILSLPAFSPIRFPAAIQWLALTCWPAVERGRGRIDFRRVDFDDSVAPFMCPIMFLLVFMNRTEDYLHPKKWKL